MATVCGRHSPTPMIIAFGICADEDEGTVGLLRSGVGDSARVRVYEGLAWVVILGLARVLVRVRLGL